ncbi:MAG: hypothetical protein GY832_13315 [Chloroflexi bacterium]|nr:hypothetical protein [Chloroflexota bacterium]
MEIPDIPLSEEGDNFQTVVAILIAIVTIMGAVLAWRASVAGDGAGDADFAGLNAVLNAEQTLTLNNSEFFKHYRAYTSYAHRDGIQELVGQDPESSTDANLHHQQNEAASLARTNQLFFPPRYLNRDGSYAIQREFGEAWAEAGQSIDLFPESHFAEADQLRIKANWLVAIFIPLSLALFLYTLAEGAHPERQSLRYGMAAGGTAFLLITVIATIIVEMTL